MHNFVCIKITTWDFFPLQCHNTVASKSAWLYFNFRKLNAYHSWNHYKEENHSCTWWRTYSCKIVYHGSNSWMMLSNRMTANNLELNPTSQASDKMKNVSKLCHAPVRHIFERMSFFTPASAMTVCTSFRHVKVSANQRLASARSRSANRSSAEHWCNIQKILIKCFCLFSYGFFEKRDL